MFDFLSHFKSNPKLENKQYKNAVDKIFENAKDDKVTIVGGQYKKSRTISKKDFFKIMSI